MAETKPVTLADILDRRDPPAAPDGSAGFVRMIAGAPRGLTLAFVGIYLVIGLLWGAFVWSDDGEIAYLRDHGRVAVATVIDHDTTRADRSGRMGYSIRFAYTVGGPGGGAFKVWQDCHASTYERFGKGAEVPILYDPRRPGRARTHIEGSIGNRRLILIAVLDWVAMMLPALFFLSGPWLLGAYIADQMRGGGTASASDREGTR